MPHPASAGGCSQQTACLLHCGRYKGCCRCAFNAIALCVAGCNVQLPRTCWHPDMQICHTRGKASSAHLILDLALPSRGLLGTHVVPPKVHNFDNICKGWVLLSRPITSTPVASEPQEMVQTLRPGAGAAGEAGSNNSLCQWSCCTACLDWHTCGRAHACRCWCVPIVQGLGHL